MCFSASVSFGSAALLLSVGTLVSVINHSKSYRMLTVFPLFFGLQQALEGLVWVTMGLNSSQPLHQFGILGFLGFALIIWPSWAPWSIFYIEPNKGRKKILYALGVTGLCVSITALWILSKADVKAYSAGYSLGYSISHFQRYWSSNFEFLAYVVPTLIPFFVSSLKPIKTIGCLIFAGMVIAQVMNQEASISVWCFFAALISFYVSIFIYNTRFFYQENKSKK